jgi:hypothetical protein
VIRCLFGIRGQGKTWLCRELAGEDPASHTIRPDAPSRVLIYDPFIEHAAVYCTWPDVVEYVESALPRGGWRCALVEPLTHGEAFCVLAWVVAQRLAQGPAGSGGLLVVIEEVDQVAPPGREPLAFRRLVAQGRHVGIDMITTSRRPAEVSRLLTSQAEEIRCGRTHEPKDVTYLRAIMGELAEQVPRLGPHQFITWTPQGTPGEGTPGDPGRLPPEETSTHDQS